MLNFKARPLAEKTRASEEALRPTGYSHKGNSLCIVAVFKKISTKSCTIPLC